MSQLLLKNLVNLGVKKILGVGSSRVVIELDNKKVIKIAYNSFGCLQNKVEREIFDTYGKKFPLNSYDSMINFKDYNDFILISNKAISVNDLLCTFYNQPVDYRVENLDQDLIDFLLKNFGEFNLNDYSKFEEYKVSLQKRIVASLPSLKEVIGSYSEISLDNLGVLKNEDGEIEIVAIDYGILSDDIQNEICIEDFREFNIELDELKEILKDYIL